MRVLFGGAGVGTLIGLPVFCVLVVQQLARFDDAAAAFLAIPASILAAGLIELIYLALSSGSETLAESETEDRK
jgi:hypothetical protein